VGDGLHVSPSLFARSTIIKCGWNRFTTCLDGAKTGKVVRKEVFQRHEKTYGPFKLGWKDSMDSASKETSSRRFAQRNSGLEEFIMNNLVQLAKDIGEDILATFHERQPSNVREDEDLMAPWVEARRRAKQLRELDAPLDRIKKHVSSIKDSFNDLIGPKSPTQRFADHAIETRQDGLRALSKEFWDTEFLDVYPAFAEAELRRLMASCAYVSTYATGILAVLTDGFSFSVILAILASPLPLQCESSARSKLKSMRAKPFRVCSTSG